MTIKQFLETSYTAYHTVANCAEILEGNGFSRLFLGEKWSLKKGDKRYVVKNDSAVVAFVVGDLTEYEFSVAACHTDSPCLHVKGNDLVDSVEGKRINVEKYGGGILYSFLDIPLKIAGRLVVEKDGALFTKLATSDFFVNVPSLCIHHNPTVNDGVALKEQSDMLPLLGDAKDVWSTLTDENVVDADLYVVPAVAPYASGSNGEYIVSPRLDNLTGVFASIGAICSCSPKGVAVCCCFDNEEIGSGTKQGARSVFLTNVLRQINDALGKTEADFLRATEGGFVLSVDNGHAVHPAHPEKSDPTGKVTLGGGVVVKHHVNYCTDGYSSAVAKTIARSCGVKTQDYYNNSDVRCGSTLGLFLASNLAMDSCDVGVAQLAMHSALETACLSDVEEMQRFLQRFFDVAVCKKHGGETCLK